MANGQLKPMEIDHYKSEINKNIFRVLLGFSSDNGGSFIAMYEHRVHQAFTVVVKAGPACMKDGFWIDSIGNTKYRFAFNVIASGELRYYFNLQRRIRLEKTTRNFSAGYFSLEPFVTSKTLFFIYKGEGEINPGNAGVYINVGYQKQFKKRYFNVYFGTRLPGKVYSNSVDVSDIIHFGVTIGRAFQ